MPRLGLTRQSPFPLCDAFTLYNEAQNFQYCRLVRLFSETQQESFSLVLLKDIRYPQIAQWKGLIKHAAVFKSDLFIQ